MTTVHQAALRAVAAALARVAALVVAAVVALAALAGCGPEQKTPLPTKGTTIDRVNSGLERSQQDIDKGRKAVDDATK